MFDGYVTNPQPAPPPPAPKELKFDKSYLTTVPGILKIVELACNILGFIFIKISWAFISSIIYNLTYWLASLITVFLLIMYMYHFVEKFDHWPWLKMEFFYCIGVILVYLVASLLGLIEGVWFVVEILGLCAILAYGYDAYLKYEAWKRGLPPQ